MGADTERAGKQHLHETGSHSLMGKLLRRFWHPIALSRELQPGHAMAVRVLSEDLTLYRGQSGTAHLVGGRCAHRCTKLHTGWIEKESIRCMYHGWLFNEDGLCTEIPAESKPRAKAARIAAYPVQEYMGLVFAWLGNSPAPAFDLPRKDPLEAPGTHVFAKREIWPANWFQQVENSMDAVHVGFAHMWGVVGEFGAHINGGVSVPALSYEETSSGIRQIARRSESNVRISDWTFPNNNHVVAPTPDKAAPWGHISAWPVPVDDRNTMRFTLYTVTEENPDKLRWYEEQFDLDYDPSHDHTRLFSGDLSNISEPGLISAQDYVAVCGQGEIADRFEENLSTSDAGVIFLRRVFLRELECIRQDKPTKDWGRLAEAAHLPPPPTVATE
jgi:5,5'-dehydrodivanillate O-demethylase